MDLPDIKIGTKFGNNANRRRICSICAAIKQACDGCIPCGRCERLSLECYAAGSGQLPHPRKAAKIKRVHTGCVTCKKRKRKCDEQKRNGKCGSCSRLCLECVWKDDWRKNKRTTDDDETLVHSRSEVFAMGSPTISATGEVYTPSEGSIGSIEPEDDLSVTTPVTIDSSASIDDSFMGTAVVLPRPPSIAPDLTTDQEKDLLGHFISTTSVSLSRSSSGTTNPYLRFLLPLAFSEKAVMYSLLAISATQRQCRDPSMERSALSCQSRATKRLTGLLSSMDGPGSVAALASSLVLCLTDLYSASTDGWTYHLKGAQRLLQVARCQSPPSQWSDELRFLGTLYRFIDSATTISTCRPPLAEEIDDDESSQQVTSGGPHPLPDDAEMAIYGIPHGLFHLLDRVNSLAYQRKHRVNRDSEMAFRHTARSVADAIESYSDERIISETVLDGVDAGQAGIAFKWAVRLRLIQIVDGYEIDNHKVAQAVNKILEAVQQITMGSSSELCLVFPLVMAASSCKEPEHRCLILARLSDMQARLGFGQLAQAKKLIERIWASRDRSMVFESHTNWAHIRYYELNSLAIF